jgi:hypothetical protein
MRNVSVRIAIVAIAVLATAAPAGAAHPVAPRIAIRDATCDATGTIDIAPGLSNVARAETLRFNLQLSCGGPTATMSGSLHAPAADCSTNVASAGQLAVQWSDSTTSTVHMSLTFKLQGNSGNIGEGIATLKGKVRSGTFVGDSVSGSGGVEFDESGTCQSNPWTSWDFFSHRSAFLKPFIFRHSS